MATKKSTSKDIATQDTTSNVPAEFLEELVGDAGRGGESVTADDMTIPFVKVAQALSPELKKNEASYIEELEEGDFFNSATQEVWKNEGGGITFVPVLYMRKYLEWLPEREGFVGEHGPEIIQQTSKGEKGENFLSNGNEIIITGTWYVLIVNRETGDIQRGVVSLAKTQLKKSRALMTKLKSVTLKSANGPFNPALFYNLVDATTAPEQSGKNSWMGWVLKLGGNVFDLPNGADIYATAKSFLKAVENGTVKEANHGTSGATEASDDGEEIGPEDF